MARNDNSEPGDVDLFATVKDVTVYEDPANIKKRARGELSLEEKKVLGLL